MTNPLEYTATSLTDTSRLGHLIAICAAPATVISLVGPLGAGKTHLVQSIAEGMGIDRKRVTSPTFVLVNEYRGGRLPVYHFDVYRLRDLDEFLALGPDEYFEGDGVTLVEWGNRVAQVLPPTAWQIEVEPVDDTSRLFKLLIPNDDQRSQLDAVLAASREA